MDGHRDDARGRVLLTGATGFVGRHLYPELVRRGYDVRCASRDVEGARRRHPNRTWVELDLERPETIGPALDGVRIAYFLVHSLKHEDDRDFEETERAEAESFARAAAAAGVERIIYLGGTRPRGGMSKHLRSRLRTGEILRSGSVPALELRASMIIGPGSESWCIVRDLSVRLPLMLLPRWLEHHSQPVAIEDVVFALGYAAQMPLSESRVLGIPGPDTLSGIDVLLGIAELRGTRPLSLRIPLVTPRLSSYWIGLVTRANYDVARELVEGLTSELTNDDEEFWPLVPGHRRISFHEAAQRSLAEEAPELPLRTRVFEEVIRRVSPKARGET